jgi:outer membrane protein TolC
MVADYGFQGVRYEFNNQQDFFIGSLVLQWKFFDGFAAQRKAAQQQIKGEILKKQYDELKQQINLQVMQAFMDVESARQKIEAGQQKLKASRDNYRFVRKQFEQNLVPQIELLDAQNQLSSTEIEQVVHHYNYLIALAKFDYITGTKQEIKR